MRQPCTRAAVKEEGRKRGDTGRVESCWESEMYGSTHARVCMCVRRKKTSTTPQGKKESEVKSTAVQRSRMNGLTPADRASFSPGPFFISRRPRRTVLRLEALLRRSLSIFPLIRCLKEIPPEASRDTHTHILAARGFARSQSLLISVFLFFFAVG
jgi:hypothetical protein